MSDELYDITSDTLRSRIQCLSLVYKVSAYRLM